MAAILVAANHVLQCARPLEGGSSCVACENGCEIPTDSWTTVQLLRRATPPLDCAAQWQLFRSITNQVPIQLEWIPSHGKQQHWTPPHCRQSVQTLRALNEKADVAAEATSSKKKVRIGMLGNLALRSSLILFLIGKAAGFGGLSAFGFFRPPARRVPAPHVLFLYENQIMLGQETVFFPMRPLGRHKDSQAVEVASAGSIGARCASQRLHYHTASAPNQ